MVRMRIEELKLGGGERKEYEGKCHDCSKEVRVVIDRDEETGAIVIEGGAVYSPVVGMPPVERIYLKCNACFEKSRRLTSFVDCEVYSRVVGYLRPVKQWNAGKRSELRQRVEFKNTGGK